MTLPLPDVSLPKKNPPVPSLGAIRALLPKSYEVLRSISGNMSGYPNHDEDPYGSWEAIVQAGKSYLYGESHPLANYLEIAALFANGNKSPFFGHMPIPQKS
jgi:hypothetical protein